MPIDFPSKSSAVLTLPAKQHSVLAGLLSYLIPGLGQIYQGRVSKGAFFMVVLLGLFVAGQALGDWQNVYLPNLAQGPEGQWKDNPWKLPGPLKPLANVLNHRWQYAGQFWIGVAAWPALLQYAGVQPPVFPDYQRGPNINADEKDPAYPPRFEEALREHIRTRDKTLDVAWVYTVIAGVLNILVIYDAFAGPAYGSGAAEKREPLVPTQEAALS